MKKSERRNAWKISTAGDWQISFSVQTGNRRKQGTRVKEQQPGGWRRSFSEHQKRKAIGRFSYYNSMACLLDVRQIKTTGEYTDRVNQYATTASRLLLPVHTEQVPSPNNATILSDVTTELANATTYYGCVIRAGRKDRRSRSRSLRSRLKMRSTPIFPDLRSKQSGWRSIFAKTISISISNTGDTNSVVTEVKTEKNRSFERSKVHIVLIKYAARTSWSDTCSESSAYHLFPGIWIESVVSYNTRIIVSAS